MKSEDKKDRSEFRFDSIKGRGEKHSADELGRIVSANLKSDIGTRVKVPTWIIRLISMFAGAGAIFLIFFLLR